MLSSKYLFAIKCYHTTVNIPLPTHTHRKISGKTKALKYSERLFLGGGFFTEFSILFFGCMYIYVFNPPLNFLIVLQGALVSETFFVSYYGVTPIL